MSKYQDSIHIRYSYVQTESGTKCLDDYYKERFDTLQEACDKADKYDLLVELIKSYNVKSFGELEEILKNSQQPSHIKLAPEDLYTIIRSVAWLDSSLTMPDYFYLTGLIEQGRKEYQIKKGTD